MGALAIHIMAADASVLDDHAACLVEAAVAVVHADPDRPAAQDLCAALSVGWPALPIIALVSNVRALTSWYVKALFEGALIGLVDLETGSAELQCALEAAAHGRVAVLVAGDPVHGTALAAALSGCKPGAAEALAVNLTARERAVFEMLTEGASDKEIAAQLEMSRNTVGNHVRRIQTKLGARTRVELGLVIGRRQPSKPGERRTGVQPLGPATGG
jgi:DNA-binding NarL/FixJ family response regulator